VKLQVGSADRIVHYCNLREMDSESRDRTTAACIDSMEPYLPTVLTLKKNMPLVCFPFREWQQIVLVTPHDIT